MGPIGPIGPQVTVELTGPPWGKGAAPVVVTQGIAKFHHVGSPGDHKWHHQWKKLVRKSHVPNVPIYPIYPICSMVLGYSPTFGWCFFVFSSGLGNQIQLIQLLATAQGPGHPTEHLGSQTLWRESWDNFDITSWLVKWLKWLHTILFKHKKFSVELISVDSPWFTNQFPKNSTPTPKPPIRSYQAPKRFPLLWWIFWGNSSDWPALCVAQLRHLRACW
jgi:hypothetical protein